MPKKHQVDWNKVDEFLAGLETKETHEIEVRREAIPLVFVPGIMGTHLRRPGTNGEGEADGFPNLRWSTGTWWVLSNLAFARSDGAYRRRLIVGKPHQSFNPDYLEVDEDSPPGDGWRGIMEDYHIFLEILRKHDWKELDKYFVFPVYAVGYNWTDDVKSAGTYLAKRIDNIIEESRKITGLCEKVILISHSMGGLVSRTASELCGAKDKIVGIVHGVQPVNGSPGAYWRMKAGFEGFNSLGLVQRALGNDGPKVTAIMGNIPGGLTLLPNKLYRANDGKAEWVRVTDDGGRLIVAKPQADPYEEIYRRKAVVQPKAGEKPSTNEYWGLVDPALLNPEKTTPEGGDPFDEMNAELNNSWDLYLKNLAIAEALHDALSPPSGPLPHPQTLAATGIQHKSADAIEMKVESNWVRSDPYPNQGFRGFFVNAAGKDMQAVLQDPAGDGDGTVPTSSGVGVDAPGRPSPGDITLRMEHQPAYENELMQQWAIKAITAMVKHRYWEQRKGKEGPP
jgi:hypothetical protein